MGCAAGAEAQRAEGGEPQSLGDAPLPVVRRPVRLHRLRLRHVPRRAVHRACSGQSPLACSPPMHSSAHIVRMPDTSSHVQTCRAYAIATFVLHRRSCRCAHGWSFSDYVPDDCCMRQAAAAVAGVLPGAGWRGSLMSAGDRRAGHHGQHAVHGGVCGHSHRRLHHQGPHQGVGQEVRREAHRGTLEHCMPLSHATCNMW